MKGPVAVSVLKTHLSGGLSRFSHLCGCSGIPEEDASDRCFRRTPGGLVGVGMGRERKRNDGHGGDRHGMGGAEVADGAFLWRSPT
jgi:hypothetical protein